MELQRELEVNRKLYCALEIDLENKEITLPQAKNKLDKIILNLNLISQKLEREIKQELYDKEMKTQETLI